jgi:hypothetical protein
MNNIERIAVIIILVVILVWGIIDILRGMP